MDLVIASKNLHKIREFREMLKTFKHIEVLSLLHFPNYEPTAEEGNSFQEIALIKARHAASVLKMNVLADDSGLVVPVLNGSPGINSRRYAGEEATDSENRQKLLSALSDKQDAERSAYFECCLVFAKPDGYTKIAKGICEGQIIHEERGRNGFGYDSIFVKNEYKRTFAELPDSIKNRISHRRKAFDKLNAVLETIESS